MTTHLLEGRPADAGCVARVLATPAGDVELEPSDEGTAAYGPVELAWYPDRLLITAFHVGPASITETYLNGDHAQDLVFEIRLPSLDELVETVPGAD